MASRYATRVAKLESSRTDAICDCAHRPEFAATYEDERRWSGPRPPGSIQRATEEAKLDFTCRKHGKVGPKLHVVIRSFYLDGSDSGSTSPTIHR
jgi:hypothetical protein